VRDMNGAFEAEVRAHCPHVAIVYDLFHVVTKYGAEVIDRVRVDETNRIGRADPENRRATAARPPRDRGAADHQGARAGSCCATAST